MNFLRDIEHYMKCGKTTWGGEGITVNSARCNR
jgi:hypothetical protein